jgi:xanthine dehydrogenase accessory factor
LVEVEGSAPLESGATMLISGEGEIEGSITGGCVEGAIAAEAERIFAGGDSTVVTFGFSDELAGTVGLSCGGIVHLFVRELEGDAGEVEREGLVAAGDGRAVAIATVINGRHAGAELAIVDGCVLGSLGGDRLLDHSVARDAAGMLAQGVSGVRRFGADGATLGADIQVQVRSFAPPPQMIIIGAIDFSAALSRIAAQLGYAVTICDPRRPFIRSPRFEEAATVLVGWPQEVFADRALGPRDAVLVFSHDAKLDEPAIQAALGSQAGYVGALGSRRTTAERHRRLLEAGVAPGDLARLHAPCGLDIGGSTPEEVAISVLAEIVAARSGRRGEQLRKSSAPIHRALPAASDQ